VNRELKRRTALWLWLAVACWTPLARAQSDPGLAAVQLEQQGKTAEAEAAWSALAKAFPKNPEPLAHLGLLEARQEHYSEAIGYYRKAMALNPAMPRLRFNLGLAYFKAGQYKDALGIFNPLFKAEQPGSDEAQRLSILIGMSHYGLAEFGEAVPYLKQATAHDAENLPLQLTLARSCLLSKDYPCVLDAFHRILALNPESAEAHMLMGEALDAMTDTAGAMREMRAAIEANPKEPNAHFGLGYLLWTQGKTEEASKEFEAELDLVPGHDMAALYLADAEIQMNKLDEARPLLERVVKSNPANAMGHLELGIVLIDAGE